MKKMMHISCWDNNLAVKLGVSVFLCALAFMLLHHRSSGFSLVSNSSLSKNTQNNSASSVTYVEIQEYADQIQKRSLIFFFPLYLLILLSLVNSRFNIYAEMCDLFVGDWVPYEGEPLYNKSCSFIADSQNCMKNGRPDSNFMHWRWKPRACDLPRFDPLEFLDTMRNKNWAFIGDSLSRNHAESLMCMLSSVEQPTLVYRDEGYKFLRWLFPSYNLTLSVIWSPFLAKAIIPTNIYDASPSEVELHLDKLDSGWTDHYKTWDHTVFSSGKWYSRSSIYYEDNTIVACHYCPKRNFTELGFDSAYRRVMKSVFDYIIESNHTSSIFYRTTSPDHFEGAEWFDGGACERKGPAKEGEVELSWLDRTLRDIEMEEFGKAHVRASQIGVKLRLLDVNVMSLLRPDGHPGTYRLNHTIMKRKSVKKVISDCLHWCLPGPIDSWNDVLLEMIREG